jgi:regulator of protease activity HflC (stomatin/prohibitin superfamily)
MAWFIIGLFIIVATAIAALIAQKGFIAIIGVVVGVGMIFLSTVYTQDVGEALVIKNADGTVDHVDMDAGFGMKAPWQDTISWDITGQQIVYKGNGQATQSNEVVDGPEITVSGSDKLSSNVDAAVRYSLDARKIEEIYTAYKTQENFENRVISKDSQTVIRDSANKFATEDLPVRRAEYSKAIEDNLRARWEPLGIKVDSIALQNIRIPQSVQDKFTKTQEANAQIIAEQAQTKVIQEQAKQKVIEAKGVADANNTLNGSLTDKILQDKYIQALANSKSLVVVPNGSTPMVGIPQNAK